MQVRVCGNREECGVDDPPEYDILRDDEDDDPDAQFSRGENDSSKEYVVYLVDASPKMLNTICNATTKVKEESESHFQIALTFFAVAFSGSSSRPQLVALIAQDEVIQSGVQIEPPGMHMIYLPYSDDIRHIEERYSDTSGAVTKASDDQIKRAADLIKRVDLKDFSVFQFTNPVSFTLILY
ncbi:ATP-dependent DNA helicase 2 subunit ku70-like protein [Trifolium pratense]|uniref:ATP-dependent DNA helicase 2 subunit ku70-like protein n=1 Tax=Trifolium pratense TaxID=57577 RepID=A0A2K3NQX8_TRIPR|nr:ATP-dependent DNA helicase 2 subunit ku70-like protein [Trifolium pratense]